MKVLAIITLGVILAVITGGVSYAMWLASGFWWLGLATIAAGLLIAAGIHWSVSHLS